MDPNFDPSQASAPDSGIFGLPHSAEQAAVHVLGVPFDATASYRKGAARGPAAVLRASRQVDLFDLLTGRPYEQGIAMLPIDARLVELNAEATALADPIIAAGGDVAGDGELRRALQRVNAIGDEVNRLVEASCLASMEQGRLVAVLGGDHSVPFGAFRAAARHMPGFGVLHFDAHADLRVAYEGFTWSHASIMHNAIAGIDGIARLAQVGLRDLSEDEHDQIEASRGRIGALFDHEWAFARAEGRDLRALARTQIDALPRQVWVSFDIDGLDPALCPNTGTPVPGGLSWNDTMLWLDELVRSGREIVGVDLVEVSPGDAPDDVDSHDAMVGARLLYRLIGFALKSRR